ncbi:MAG: YhbY family RNA-binding protein [Candidatus Woesearchaeota archaeon]
MDKQEKQLKVQSRELKPFTNVGKSGVSENTIMQLERHLKAHKLSKIRVLPTYLDETGKDIKEVAEELSVKTRSKVVDVRGQTISFYRR